MGVCYLNRPPRLFLIMCLRSKVIVSLKTSAKSCGRFSLPLIMRNNLPGTLQGFSRIQRAFHSMAAFVKHVQINGCCFRPAIPRRTRTGGVTISVMRKMVSEGWGEVVGGTFFRNPVLRTRFLIPAVIARG